MFEKVGVPILGIVENMAVHVCANCGHVEHIFGADGGKRMAAEYKMDYLGALPLNMRIRVQADSGRPTRGGRPRRRDRRHLQGGGAPGGGEDRAEGQGLLGEVPDDHGLEEHLSRSGGAADEPARFDALPRGARQHRHFGRAAQRLPHHPAGAVERAARAGEGARTWPSCGAAAPTRGSRPRASACWRARNRMLREQELLRQDLHSGAGSPQRRAAIGAVPTACPVRGALRGPAAGAPPGIVPIVRSLSSHEIETGLESLSLDMGLGYTDRGGAKFTGVCRSTPSSTSCCAARRGRCGRAAAPGRRRSAGPRRPPAPLCLLTPEMHNRTIVDAGVRAGRRRRCARRSRPTRSSRWCSACSTARSARCCPAR